MKLTPAQIQFLNQHIPEFTMAQLTISNAGYAGSDRRFIRLQKEKESFVLVLWNSRDEDWPRFLDIERQLRETISFLPRIFAHDVRHGLILEEDLGTDTLKISCLQYPDNIELLYRKALDALIAWQAIAPAQCPAIAARALDNDVLLWESSYFASHCVTEFFGCEALMDGNWEAERRKLATEVAAMPLVCIHRDFQSENILLSNSAIKFVDFQGARLGPAGYDVASLLFDPYIEKLDSVLCKRLFGYYQSKTDGTVSTRTFYLCAAQRLMQALGAYGNLSLHKGKDWYRNFMPIAIERCIGVAAHLPEFPTLSKILNACKEKLGKNIN